MTFLSWFVEDLSPLSLFLLQVGLFGAVLATIGYVWRIYPHAPLVLAMSVPCVLSAGLFASDRLLLPILVIDAVVVVIAIVDIRSLPRKGAITAQRSAGRIASLKQAHRVSLIVTNHSDRPCFAWIRDGAVHELQAEPDEFRLLLGGRSRTKVEYEIKSLRRGVFRLTTVYLRARSRFALWQRFLECPAETVIHVYPDMKQLSEYALLARTNRLSLVGVRRTRRIGQDNEFERLRDYTPDDNYKHIDWRSTARRGKLTVKDFQRNQSQRLIFLIDCGRMMTNEAGGLSLLDHALNSMLMLSYVALSHGDSVGLVCFSDAVHAYVPPRGGLNHMNRLLHASFDRFGQLVESRFDLAFLYLAAHCRKRSLVVLISNVIDEVNSNQVQQYLGSLAGRHLPLGVLMRDHRLFDFAEMPDPSGEKLYQAAAAAEILTWRHHALKDLASKGVLALDVFPEDMTAPLVNQYLDIKARHLL